MAATAATAQTKMGTAQRAWATRDNVLSRSDVEVLIAEGRRIVIFDGHVLKTDAWLPFHPGGDMAILHMIGRDATNEIRAFHSIEAQNMMLKYRIGRINGLWRDFVPPIQGGKFRTRDQQSEPSDPETSTDEVSSQGTNPSEPSPIFDPAQRRERSHSTSSLSDLDLDLDENTAKPTSNRTEQELLHDLQMYPSLDAATQADIVFKYRELDAKIHAAGLYNCNYTAYLIETLRYTALALSSYYLLTQGWYAISGILLGLMWQQLVFTVHDAGHMGITHNYQIDTVIGILIADFIGGLSCCWWKRNHNVHHIVTNSVEHDPDIQHMPFFAISHRFFQNLKSTYYNRIMSYDLVARFTLQFQHYMYYPLLTFGRFNLYALSWQYILLGQGPRKGPARWHRYLELIGQVFFWYWYGYLIVYKSIPTNGSRVVFFLLSHFLQMPVHVQITLSHFAMSTADLGVKESFPQRMLRTTMDVDCPEWLDFVHGGLQFQAVHHLFPRIPRHNLRKTQGLVLDFCRETKIPYAIYGFAEGNGKVIGHLAEIAKQARIMRECGDSMVH
ncbi:fatty acid desaturase [Piedraia hortae CBS 480.64]|uniref:Delta 8-(E)-sphingolipid desaturase n=1 Tax=Piedraia hortae CBS 480.64 TaxID=1314780 RepID=A0A6A7BY69_9PEZI|nr:fatty acid desaturase [Piedraia hortae CBS 480.64]